MSCRDWKQLLLDKASLADICFTDRIEMEELLTKLSASSLSKFKVTHLITHGPCVCLPVCSCALHHCAQIDNVVQEAAVELQLLLDPAPIHLVVEQLAVRHPSTNL